MSENPSSRRPYHHGNLRFALINEALQVIQADGIAALNLRDLARRLGVSHAAPAYHFADKTALLTAIAAEGYEKLSNEQEQAAGKGFLESGLAYVRFAVQNPGYVRVMFEPSLYDTSDEALAAAQRRSAGFLFQASGGPMDESTRQVGLAGWCLMHGFAMLWLQGNLREAGDDAESAARRIAAVTFGGGPPSKP
jgi:AcrR family transcriptional regulator